MGHSPGGHDASSSAIPMRRFSPRTRYQRLVDDELEPGTSVSEGAEEEAFDDLEDLDDESKQNATTKLLRDGHSLALGVPGDEKRFWFQRGKKVYDPDAIATQPSVFE